MIVAGSLEYGSVKKAQALPAAQYSVLRSIFSDLPESQEDLKEWTHLAGTHFFNADELAAITSLGLKVEVSKTSTPHKSLMDAGPVSGGAMAGQPIHIHVPSIGLLAIDEVTWIEDACTESLQRHLNDGWRILAVCPPNLQRRPDYILGRTKSRGDANA